MGESPHPSATPAPDAKRRRNARPKARPDRPPKPYPTFELFPHAKGYWCKKIAGRQVPFGKWEWPNEIAYEHSWRAALKAYYKHLEDEKHGRLMVERPELMTVADVVDAFLTHHHGRARGKVQEIKSATFAEKRRVVNGFRDFVGPATTVGELEAFDPTRPGDCLILRYVEEQKRTYGWYRFNSHMGIVAGMWTWAEHPVRGVLGRPFRLKPFFEKHDERLRLKEKEKRVESLGKQLWTPDELLAFFTFAPMPLRAMLKLEYFAGFGNSDCSDLYQAAITWEPEEEYALPKGWGIIHFPRPKTGIERAAIIPTTAMQDLRAALDARPEPENDAWANRVFLTRFGRPWVRDAVHADEEDPEQIGRVVSDDALGKEFTKLRDRLSRCDEHGWFAAGRDKGQGYRSDKKKEARASRRPEALEKCPRCGKKMKPMRKLGAYTFRHTSITRASGVSDEDARALFEGHAIGGIRRRYVEEVEVHKLLPIAVRLLQKSGLPAEAPSAVTQSASPSPVAAPSEAPGTPAGAAPSAEEASAA